MAVSSHKPDKIAVLLLFSVTLHFLSPLPQGGRGDRKLLTAMGGGGLVFGFIRANLGATLIR
jgi:hypothetical protein